MRGFDWIVRGGVMALLAVFLMTGCAMLPESLGGTRAINPSTAAVARTVVLLAAARLASEHPEKAKTAAGIAKSFAVALRALAADEDVALKINQAILLAMSEANIDPAKLDKEVKFWLNAMPTLLASFAEDGNIDAEGLRRAADKIDELVGQFLLI